MNRKIFNRKLYLDSLRRTSVIGGLFTVLLVVASLLIFSAYIMNGYDMETDRIVVRVLNFYEINPFLFAIPYTLTPLLCLNLFGFLNKRSTSDFWHSVPFSRTCLFNSFSAAVLTWSAIAVIVPSAVSLVCFSMYPALFAINWATVLSMFLGLISAILLVLAGANIAMSVTGTYFSNIIVATLILFLPRILLLFFAYASSNSRLFVINTDGSWLAPAMNIVAGMVLQMGNAHEIICSYTSIIYTAILAAVYYAVGLVLFNIRKSESAGHSAINKYMQAAFRIIVCFTVCLFPIYLIIEELNRNQDTFRRDDWFTVFTLYVVAIAAYFIYELITTKKLKNLLKAIPALGIVALLNILTISGANIAYRVEYSYTPNAAEVTEICFGNPHFLGGEYFETAVSKLVISDNSIEQLLCDAYVDTRRAYETSNLHNAGDYNYIIGFKSNGITHYRYVYLDEKTNTKLTNMLYQNPSYWEVFDIEKIFEMQLGEYLSIHLPYNSNGQDVGYSEELAQAYIEDVKALDFDTWYKIATSHSYNVLYLPDDNQEKYGYVIGELAGHIPVGNQNTYFSLPISNFTPKSYNMLMNMIMNAEANAKPQKELIDALKNDTFILDPEESKYQELSIELYNGKRKSNVEYYSISNYEMLSKLIEVLEPTVGQVADSESRIGIVYYHKFEKDTSYSGTSYSAVFRIPDDADLTFLLGDDLKGDNMPNTDMEIDYEMIK